MFPLVSRCGTPEITAKGCDSSTMDLREKFRQTYGREDGLRIFFAPGRVNLIGEHIDYSGGHVFPCAIERGTYLAIRKREDTRLLGFSENFRDHGILQADLGEICYNERRGWLNYVTGVFASFQKSGYPLKHGFDLYIKGRIPLGAGLSSSASLEVAVALAVNACYGLNLDKLDLVKLCHRAENEYMDVKCGIMDQFAVAMGKRDCGLLLDCRDLTFRKMPLNLGDKALVIVNSKQKRTLVDSKYNDRRESCEEALQILQRHRRVDYLCDITPREFAELQVYLEDPETRKRVRHAVEENARVLEAAGALEAGDWNRVGELMRQSHQSLQREYEVSTGELDLLVELARGCPGVRGARMTGAGFGGCTVNVVEVKEIAGFISRVSRGYLRETGLEPEFYVTGASDGARELKAGELEKKEGSVYS